MENVLVTDFDGTITSNDFYALVAQRYMPGIPLDHYFAQYREGRLSHFEAMAAYFAYTPTDEASVARLLTETAPDPDLAKSIERLRTASWDLIIVSAGSSWYINKILAAAGVDSIVVHSNPGSLEPGRGLVLKKAIDSPFFSKDVGVDKLAVVTDALTRYKKVAFAGDGPPDVLPALKIAPGLRFARAYLAEELQRRDEPFHPFHRWSEIVDHLL